jgi:hypothetical protein
MSCVGWGALKRLSIRRVFASKVEEDRRVSSVLSITQSGALSGCTVRGGLGRGLVRGLGSPVHFSVFKFFCCLWFYFQRQLLIISKLPVLLKIHNTEKFCFLPFTDLVVETTPESFGFIQNMVFKGS